MNDEMKQLAMRALALLELFLIGRIVFKISLGLIGAGISVLGFSNLVPYVVVLIRPELASSVELQNTILTTTGIILVIIGATLPIFIHIFKHYKSLYISDLEKMNSILAIYDIDTFQEDMEHIASNMTMFTYQQNKMEKLYSHLLNSSFYFNNRKINHLIKKLGNEVQTFDSKSGLMFFPTPTGHLYVIPPERRSSLQDEITSDCRRLHKTFADLNVEFEKLQKQNYMRIFA